MSEITQPGATGIAAQAANASVRVRIGASKNTVLFAPAGMMISFSRNFPKSAKLCIKPNGPTTFGPLRIMTAAQTFRSRSNKNAIDRDKTSVNKPIWPRTKSQPVRAPYCSIKPLIAPPYSAATGVSRPCFCREHSAIVFEARAIGFVM